MPTSETEAIVKQAAKVANDVIAELRGLGLDAFKKGGYYDISSQVHETVLRHARIALEACAKKNLGSQD